MVNVEIVLMLRSATATAHGRNVTRFISHSDVVDEDENPAGPAGVGPNEIYAGEKGRDWDRCRHWSGSSGEEAEAGEGSSEMWMRGCF